MSSPQLAFIYSPEIETLRYPDHCPLKAHRATLTRRQLIAFGLLSPGREEVAGRRASLFELQQFHSARYLEELQRAAAGFPTHAAGDMGLGGPDTPLFPDMFAYGAWAAGCALTAADVLLQGRADVAFSLLGGFHHAAAARASGFCYVNDVVLACMRLAAAGKRVAYLDIDAHHGDGVQEAFYHRDDVLTISLHEDGQTLFPWSGFEEEIGQGAGRGYSANVCLPAGTYDEAFLTAFDRVVMPLLGAFRPDAIVLELGMDTTAGDPLTHLHMSNNVVVEVMNRVLPLHTPLLVSGGGGYHLEDTVRGWSLAWRTACGETDEDSLNIGLGSARLGNPGLAGGLRDRHLLITEGRRQTVMPRLEASIDAVIANVFPYHGLGVCSRAPDVFAAA